MKLNFPMKRLSSVVRWMATTLFCVSAIAFTWQGAFLGNTSAMAAPATTLIAAADADSQVKGKVEKDAGRAKNFIQDTEQKVKEAANSNTGKVDRATDDDSLIERKAKSDRQTIQKRASEDSARTQEAVDNTKNAVEQAVDSIKGAFSN